MSWLTRQFGIRVKSEANDDIMSAAFAVGNKTIVTDARSAVEKSVWVYRAVNTVCTRIGSLPWDIYQGDKVVANKGAVLKRPNPNQTFVELLEQVTAWQMLRGFGLLYAEPLNLHSLESDRVRVDSGRLMYRGSNNVETALESKSLVVFPNFSLSGQAGLSELSPVVDAANMDENAKLVWNNQMSSGGVLAGLLSTDVRLSEQELTAFKSKWEERYGGVSRAGGIAVAGAGFKFQQMGISAADMRMLEVSQVTKNEIGTAFGVPGIFLGDMDSVDYSNALIQERILYSNTILPKADRIADRITLFLLPLLGLKGLEFRFDYSGIEALQANKLERAQIDEIQMRTGALTINEVRERDGLKPVPWGNAWWTSAMSVPVTSSEIIEPEPKPIAERPIEEVPKGIIAKGHSPEARALIAKAFIAKTAPQEKKFASVTMKVFGKQAKAVEAWVANGAKAEPATTARTVLDDADLVENWHSLYVAFGSQSMEDVAARYSMSVPDGSELLKWIKKQERTHSKYVNDTTAMEIDATLARLRAEGASIADMTKEIKGYFDGIAYRAERVARTEVIGVNNYAAQVTYEENGVKQHEWLATDDDRTREDHAGADGQVRNINEPFDIGGEQLMYPGDPNGSPEQTCNCRCVLLPVI